MAIKLMVVPDDDAEIRTYIKNLILGVVSSLTREDYLKVMVAAAIEKKLLEKMALVEKEVYNQHFHTVKQALDKSYSILNIRSDAQKCIKEQVDSFVTEDTIKAMLRTILEEKVKRMGI